MRSRLMWAGHVERMEGERLTKRVDVLRVEGTKRLRCKDCVKRDLAGVGREWRMRDGGVENEDEGWGSGE